MVSYRRLAMRVLGHVPVPFRKKKTSPPPRVAAQRIAALALACAMMTGMTLPAFAATYDISKGSIDIHATENGQSISQWLWRNENHTEYASDSDGYIQDRPDNDITITGTSTGNTVSIKAEEDQTANVTLDNVEINASSTGKAAVDVTGSGDTNIELNGNNTLTGGNQYAGLQHNKEIDAERKETSGKLTITDTDNDGKLTATGGFGGAGIGGGNIQDAGKIEITGGSITATGGLDGAGIGGGGSGGDADITISGGTINAIGGTDPWGQPGAIGGAGIGSGGSGGDATTVTITGGAVIENASGGGGCAGIGGGYSSKSDVTISGNATIETVTGGYQSAGIGGGGWGSTGTVTIKDNATIQNAQGGDGGAGIGGGVYGSTTVSIEGSPTIEDTTGGGNGAGIGGGAGGDGNVTIKGNAEIKNATGGDGGAGIGGGAVGKGTVIIDGNTTDGKVTINHAQGGDEGAGIGGGAGGLGDVAIEGKVTIQNAQGGIGAAGIGGGAESEPDDDGTGKKTVNEISIKSTEAGSPNITAKGGTASDDGLSGGAAIGSGSVYENPQNPEEKAKAAITIEGKVTIDATAGGSVAIGDDEEQTFAGLSVGAAITRKDSDSNTLPPQEGDKPEPEKPGTDKPGTDKPGTDNPGTDNPGTDKPGTDKPGTDKPGTDNPGTDNPGTDNPGTDNPGTDKPGTDKPGTDNPGTDKPGTDNPGTDKPGTDNPGTDKPGTDNPGTDKPGTDNPGTDKPGTENPNPEQPSQPEQPSEPSGAVSTFAPAEELTASDAEYLVTVEGLSVTNALEKQITHSCTQNVQGKVLTIRTNSIVATAHLTMETLRTLKAQGVETIRFCTLLYRPTSVSIDALLNLGVDEADILWTHNGIQARLTVGGTDSSSLLQ